MPGDWESRFGSAPADSSDNAGDKDGDGYTNAEEYLNDTNSTEFVDSTKPASNVNTLKWARPVKQIRNTKALVRLVSVAVTAACVTVAAPEDPSVIAIGEGGMNDDCSNRRWLPCADECDMGGIDTSSSQHPWHGHR